MNNECDKYIYVKDTEKWYVNLCLYVDDMIGSNNKVIRSIKNILNSKFDIKDMGLEDMVLGVKITRIYRISFFCRRKRASLMSCIHSFSH